MREKSTRCCPICGTSIDLPPSHLRRAKYMFCSATCQRTPFIPASCKECGDGYLVTAQGVGALARAGGGFCSRDCHNARDRREQVHLKSAKTLVTCIQCAAVFPLRRSVARVQQFCSRKCFFAYDNPERRWWRNSPLAKNKITVQCASCQQPFETFPSRTRRRFCSRECRSKLRITVTCAWCGLVFDDFPSRSARRFCSSSCSAIYGMVAWEKRRTPTGIEVRIDALLTTMRVAFISQKPLGTFMVDFYVPSARLVIECDGAYWHSLPVNQGRDARKDGWLRAHRYRVLRLTEYDINSDIDWCRTLIQQALYLNPPQMATSSSGSANVQADKFHPPAA